MNERIRELYDQCFVVLEDQSPNTGFDFEKFAELIVHECCQVFWTEECYTSDLAYLDYKEKTNKIKQHFGVEE